jgi:DNA-binding transcriptional MerR regulator
MYIGQVSRETGFSRDTIRFYEEIGLISIRPGERYPNNYKKYSPEVVKRLKMVKEMKEFGFTLNEIKTILYSWDGNDLDCNEGKVKVIKKIKDIEEKMRQLKIKRLLLTKVIDTCLGKCIVEQSLSRLEREFGD